MCKLAKLLEIKATVPTFTTLDKMEGIELKGGKIIPFWIKKENGESIRVYDQPVNDTKIASVIGAFEENPEPKQTKPSEVTEIDWIYAKRKKGNYPKPTERNGKWLVFVDIENIDEVWAKIKAAVEEGKLGNRAKVATAKPNSNATDPETKVICVYTYDWADEEDVRKIREELRGLGITNKIPYKADEDTRSGKYRIKGHTKISKYYE